MPTPPQHFANGHYDRQAAVEFALRYKDKSVFEADGYPTEPNNDCTNFVSYVLQAGGLLQSDVWKPGADAWRNTPDLFIFLRDTVGFKENSDPFYNTPNVSTPDPEDYLQLRENNAYTAMKVQLVQNRWDEFIAQNQNIQPGDLVFLLDPTHYAGAWTHVEVVTGWDTETTWDSKIVNGIQEPLVVDHSGRPIITPDKLPRSVGDTAGTGIQKVVFLRAP